MIIWNITIGEILTISVAFLAFISASLIGKRQNEINNVLLKLQNSIELYILSGHITLKDATGEQKDNIVPCMFIRNLSQSAIYLNKYLFNGKEYPLYDEVLPPICQYDGFHYIFLPRDETTHVSFEVFFSSWTREKWKTKGFADLTDGQWKITYEPCQRIAKE